MNFSSQVRFLAILALALVIEGKLLHCAVEDGACTIQLMRLSRVVAAKGPDSTPVAPACCNESGCPCRGAVLISIVSHDPPAADALAILPQPACEAFAENLAPYYRNSRQLQQAPPPFGRQLRALFASFVI